MGRQVTRRPRETERQTAYGVEEGADVEDIPIILRNVADDPTTPYCSCTSRRTGFGFDAQLGVYLHADPKCWRPSKAYYEAARQAGVLAPERGSSGTEGSSQGRDREPVQAPSGDGGDRPPARRRARRLPAAGTEGAQDGAGRAAEEPGADSAGGGDALDQRSDSVRTVRRVTRRSRDTTALWSDQY